MARRCSWMSAFLVLVVTAGAAAQTPESKVERKVEPTVSFRHGSTLNLFAGASAAPSKTAVLAGGVNAFLNRHWAIRPDVQEIVVLRRSRSYVVTAVAFHVAYHFEDHPVTPMAR